MRIHAVKDVDHAATGRFARGPETFVIAKVEDVVKIRTKSTRTDRWPEENHEIEVDRANEIEITVYDKPGDHPLPIGMLWIRISDIAEEMRRKKIESEFNSAGWVSADKMENEGVYRQDSQFNSPSTQYYNAGGPPAVGGGQNFKSTGQPHSDPVAIDAWFALEPVGQIHLTMSFGEDRSLG
jgi:hypothetical protein